MLPTIKTSNKGSLLGDIDVSPVFKYTGYSPGVYYDSGDMSSNNERRFGNLVTGTGLGLAGMAAVPLMQWLFPERYAKFKGQGKRLAIAAMAAGLAVPWAVTSPHEIRAFKSRKKASTIRNRSGKYYLYSKDGKKKLGGPYNTKAEAYKRERQVQYFKFKSSALGPPMAPFGSPMESNFPILKSHLAGDILNEIQAGTLNPHAAMGFMRNVGDYSKGNKPWITVGDLTRVAVGAGVGGGLGSLVGRGLGYFVSLSPKEKRLARNAGIGLGALINTGKLGL